MGNQHPITPPPDLVKELQDLGNLDSIVLAYQAGADQELEAVIDLAGQSDLPEEDRYFDGFTVAGIRANRRRTSLKERALAALNVIEDKMLGPTTEEKLIRQALEALPND
jgi:hypothetical protein